MLSYKRSFSRAFMKEAFDIAQARTRIKYPLSP